MGRNGDISKMPLERVYRHGAWAKGLYTAGFPLLFAFLAPTEGIQLVSKNQKGWIPLHCLPGSTDWQVNKITKWKDQSAASKPLASHIANRFHPWHCIWSLSPPQEWSLNTTWHNSKTQNKVFHRKNMDFKSTLLEGREMAVWERGLGWEEMACDSFWGPTPPGLSLLSYQQLVTIPFALKNVSIWIT